MIAKLLAMRFVKTPQFEKSNQFASDSDPPWKDLIFFRHPKQR